MIAGFVRGLSVRDVEATLADALGVQAALSKSTVSRVCAAIRTEFDAWSERSLADVELDYLFLDASHFRMHPGARAEPVLAAWGIRTDGSPVLIALAPGGAESTDAWTGFLAELVERGLRPLLLVISDGAAGLISAVEQALPRSLRQRCLIHRARNVLAKVPAGAQAEVKAAFWAAFDTEDLLGQPSGAGSARSRCWMDSSRSLQRPVRARCSTRRRPETARRTAALNRRSRSRLGSHRRASFPTRASSCSGELAGQAHDRAPDLVLVEVVQRQVGQAGVLGAPDPVLAAGAAVVPQLELGELPAGGVRGERGDAQPVDIGEA